MTNEELLINSMFAQKQMIYASYNVNTYQVIDFPNAKASLYFMMQYHN